MEPVEAKANSLELHSFSQRGNGVPKLPEHIKVS